MELLLDITDELIIKQIRLKKILNKEVLYKYW